MKLIGMFDSPFVRRVAVTMQLTGSPYEHLNWSVGKDFERIRALSPIGRVPALVLDDGEVLIDSSAILDYVDERAGAHRLLASEGAQRRRALQLMAIATGAADKGVAQLYERAFRPSEKVHAPWLERCAVQVASGLSELERAASAVNEDAWLLGPSITQADITVACAMTFLDDAGLVAKEAFPALRKLTQRVEQLPAMAETRTPFSAPKT